MGKDELKNAYMYKEKQDIVPYNLTYYNVHCFKLKFYENLKTRFDNLWL